MQLKKEKFSLAQSHGRDVLVLFLIWLPEQEAEKTRLELDMVDT